MSVPRSVSGALRSEWCVRELYALNGVSGPRAESAFGGGGPLGARPPHFARGARQPGSDGDAFLFPAGRPASCRRAQMLFMQPLQNFSVLYFLK